MQNDGVKLGPRRKVAKAFAKKLIKSAGVTEAPVSLQKIIEHLQTKYSLQVQRVILSSKVSGLLVVCQEVDAEYAVIGFNATQPWCRRRFTIAHEIGHLLFGHDCIKNYEDGSQGETEANIFAAELLIPSEILKKDFVHIRDVKQLSKLYRVSEESLSIKIMADRLL